MAINNPSVIIKDDHKIVELLFKKYKKLGEGASVSKRKIVDEIIFELTRHAEMEEALCYPRFKDAFNKKDDKMIEEAYVEHTGVKSLLTDLMILEPDQPEFDASVKVLMEQIEHHVTEEEEGMLPVVEKEISKEELAIMGNEMIDFRKNYRLRNNV